ncbi:MAG: PDZ domain-containing protein [Myxococcales bacterium]|nr:PDZ domain-containing protein [Myxococcales bacterium]
MQRRIWTAFLAFLMLSLWGPGTLAPPWKALSVPNAHAQFGGYRFTDMFYVKKVAWLVEKNYVDPQQVSPQKMFLKAVRDIQMIVPSIMVKFSKDQRAVTILIDQRSKTFPLLPLRVISDVPYQLQPIFTFIKRHYKGDVKLRQIEFSVINGMLKTLDVHTNFLPPSFYKDMNIHTSGKFGGLGIVIQSQEGFITIVSPMPDTPAARAGLRSQDRIVRIGDESTINMSLTTAVNKLRGDPGTPVVIWIMRKSFSKPRPYRIVRAIIRVKSVSSHLLKDDVAYIQIKNFQQNTTSEMLAALERMSLKVKKLKGLILDLRDNPGGLLDQAIRVSDAFLSKGMIVAHAGGSSPRSERYATYVDTQPDYPIVVLINNGSASASEIVAGALKNNNRAIVIGQRSYGKGTVQVLYPIISRYSPERTALKLTVAQYLTPGDISIQDIGVAPDISLSPVHIKKDQVQLFEEKPRKSKKKKLPAYLKGVREQRKAMFRIGFLDNDEKKKSSVADEYKENKKLDMDFEIKLAHAMVTKTKVSERREMYKTLLPILQNTKLEEKKKIHDAMKKIGISWKSKPAAAPNLSISYKLTPLNGKDSKTKSKIRNGRIFAGGTYQLQVSIRNNEKTTAYRVRAVTHSKFWFLNRREFLFGQIAPKQTRRWSVEVKLPKWVNTQVHPVEIDVRGSNELHQKKLALIEIQGLERPRFAFTYALEELEGNGDGLIQPGETFALHLSVRNQGPGKALKLVAEIRNEGGSELFIQRGRIVFGKLRPNQWRTSKFLFRVDKDVYMKKALDIRLKLSDNELFTSVLDRIQIPIRSEDIAPMEIKERWVRVSERTTWLTSGAALDAPKVAFAKRGTVLRTNGRLGPFFRVLIPKEMITKTIPAKGSKKKKKAASKSKRTRILWVLARDVAPSTQKGKGSRKITPHWQYKTPEISVPIANRPVRVSTPDYRLVGSIQNNVPLLDTYILVNREKIFYRSLRNMPKLQFSLPIKLKKGRNSVIIVARETKHFVGTQEVIIYYHPKTPATSQKTPPKK